MPIRASAMLLLLATLPAAVFGPVLSHAQDAGGQEVIVDPIAAEAPTLEPGAEPGEGTGRGTGSGITPLVAPVPFKNTQLGWGLFLMVGAIHRFDPDTTLKPSTGAVGGFYTENGSWGVMAMEVARLRGDAWRLRGMLGHMSLRYDFFGIGQDAGDAGASIALQQEIDVAYGAVLRRVSPGFYLGPTLLWMRTEARLRDPSEAGFGLPPGDGTRIDLVAAGLDGEFDTRDDDYWPTAGSLAKLKASFFSDALGSSRTFQRYMAGWSWYGRMPAERLIMATNFHAAAAEGDAPFYALPSIGSGRFQFRGYTLGRYRDRFMASGQAELRYHLQGRLGGTIFGGFGLVAPDLAAAFEAKLMPAGGFGLRYQLTREFPMHMRLDLAWGRDETLFYFAVAEAF